jgi:hypothetical protein
MFMTGEITKLFTPDEERQLMQAYQTEGAAGLFVPARPKKDADELRRAVMEIRQAA